MQMDLGFKPGAAAAAAANDSGLSPNATLLEQIQYANAHLKPPDPDRKKNKPVIGFNKSEEDQLANELQLMLQERRKELQQKVLDSGSENDDSDDDSDDDSFD